jgi:DNA-directed RNA polymerase subunit RPC12/RpoP
MATETIASAEVARCPYCGHKDAQHRAKVGEAALMVCTDCGRIWMASVIGSVYRGEIGHGRVQLIWENAPIRVDADGRIRVEKPHNIEERGESDD